MSELLPGERVFGIDTATVKPGDAVVYIQTCRGGYGFQREVPAVFVRAGAKRHTIRVRSALTHAKWRFTSRLETCGRRRRLETDMAITTSPIALLEMEKAGPLGRLMAAGERLSNLGYHLATNRAQVDDRLRAEFDECSRAWDAAASEYAAVLKAEASQTHGVALIITERMRQVAAEGWTPAHDDAHDTGELVAAARAYAKYAEKKSNDQVCLRPSCWPWESSWWKPSDDPIRNLVKAGALIAAEIDRLQRKAAKERTQ